MIRARAHGPELGALAIAALYVASILLAQSALFTRDPRLIGVGITLDLTVTATWVAWLALVRPGRLPGWILAPVFLAGAATAKLAVPPEGQGALAIIGLGWALAEVGLVAALVLKGRRVASRVRALRREGEGVRLAFERARGEVLGMPRLAAALVLEVSLLAYGVGGWFLRAPTDGFSIHRRRAWPVLASVLAFLVAVETFAAHVILARWSPVAAWIATASSLYALLWLAGDAHALRLSRLRVTADALVVEMGLRWRVEIPRADLAAVRAVDTAPSGDLLRADLLWPNVLVELSRPAVAHGLFGRTRRVERISLSLDDPEGFLANFAPSR